MSGFGNGWEGHLFPSIPCVMPQLCFLQGVKHNRIEDGAKLIVCSLQLPCSQISCVCDGWGVGATSLESSCLNCVSLPAFWRLEPRMTLDVLIPSALDKTGDLQETLLDMQEAIFCDVYFFSYPTMAQAIGSMFCPFSHTHKHQTFFKSRS